MRLACVMVLVAACGSNEHAAADAAADAPACDSIGTYEPIAITGTSPNGSLDSFRFVRAGHTSGDCPDAYVIVLGTDADPDCSGSPTLIFTVLAPFDGTSLQTQVTQSSPIYSTTNQVTFEVTQLDAPTEPTPRIIGHLVSHDPAWVFDIAVDLTSQYDLSCL
jgi:hypothetical protein